MNFEIILNVIIAIAIYKLTVNVLYKILSKLLCKLEQIKERLEQCEK